MSSLATVYRQPSVVQPSPDIEEIIKGETKVLSTVEKYHVDEHAIATDYRQIASEQVREAQAAIEEIVGTNYRGHHLSERIDSTINGRTCAWFVEARDSRVDVTLRYTDDAWSSFSVLFKCPYNAGERITFEYDLVGTYRPFRMPRFDVVDAMPRAAGAGILVGTLGGAALAGTGALVTPASGVVGAAAYGAVLGAALCAAGGVFLPFAIGAVGAALYPAGKLVHRKIVHPLYRRSKLRKGDLVNILDAPLDEDRCHEVMLAALEVPAVLSRGYNQHKAKIDDAARDRMVLMEKKLSDLQQHAVK